MHTLQVLLLPSYRSKPLTQVGGGAGQSVPVSVHRCIERPGKLMLVIGKAVKIPYLLGLRNLRPQVRKDRVGANQRIAVLLHPLLRDKVS